MSEKSLPAGLERRKEDYGLITGEAHFVDDLRPAKGRPRTLYMAVVRSPYAHAEIEHIQLDAALALPGVVAAFDGSELVNSMRTLDVVPVPNLKKTERRPLAVGKVRYVGDPVAVVLAESRYIAMDARDQVEVDYTPLPAVTDPVLNRMVAIFQALSSMLTILSTCEWSINDSRPVRLRRVGVCSIMTRPVANFRPGCLLKQSSGCGIHWQLS